MQPVRATLTCALVVALVSSGTASAQSPEAAASARACLRVGLRDAQVAHCFSTAMVESGSLTVVAANGTFRLTPMSVDAFASFANAVDSLTIAPPQRRDAATSVELTSFFGRGVIRMRPVATTSSPEFRLEGSNGGWDFEIRLTGDEGAAVLRALRRERGPGVELVEADTPPRGPSADGVAYGAVIDSPAMLIERSFRVRWPSIGLPPGASRLMRFRFVVDTTGRVVPSSVELDAGESRAHVRAALAALLRARFEPARHQGRIVAQPVLFPVVVAMQT